MRAQPFTGSLAPGKHASHRNVVRHSMGGRGSFGDSPLILGPNGGPKGRPGGQSGPPGRLIIPGSPGQFSQGQGRQQRPPIGLSDDTPSSSGGSLPTANKYRPPPGFMNETVQDPALVATDPQEMLNKLRAHGGVWHSLAKFLPVLYAKGFDTNTIAEITGVNPVDQNRWVVAGTVYDSIVSTGQVEQAQLGYFDLDGDALLYHFRFLPAERRAAAASYIVANQLDEPACEVLARAMKEWERRPGERAGFTDSPGDCLAFKYLRDAIECRQADEQQEKLQLAFAAVDTQLARERLEEWQEAAVAEAATAAATASFGGSRALLTVLRLSQDELGFRPLPQVSPLQRVTPEELLSAPGTSQEGAFGAFDLPAGAATGKWVALPQWKALALAKHPVAIPLADCSAHPAVLAASRVKTDEEVKRLTGAGLLVVDTATVPGSAEELDVNGFYLVADSRTGQLDLMEGGRIAADPAVAAPLAAVLFLCRPPNRESAITSAELLQL